MGGIGSHSSSVRSRGPLYPPLTPFNNLPPLPISVFCSPRSPTLVSGVRTIALVNLLCFGKSFCHALQLLLVP